MVKIKSKKLKVPYIPQKEDWTCGGAALEMIYKYHGLTKVKQTSICKKYKKADLEGMGYAALTVEDMVDDARDRGFIAYWDKVNYRSKEAVLDVINRFINRGVPIIAVQQSTLDKKLGHYRVIFGLDSKNVYFHDPDEENKKVGGESQTLPISKFVKLWERTGKNVVGGAFIFII